jgi:esterase/lipase superfamily enzyme
MSQIHINTRSLFLILAVLISEVATAGSKDVYVLSNRETVLENDNSTALNRVKAHSGLDLMIANESANNSLMISRTDSVQFISEMLDLDGDWVVFVHGDAKTLDQSVKRGIAIQKEHDINVLIFSWPSKDPILGGVRNFKRSRSHVGESLSHFMQMLDFVQVFKDANPSFQNNQKISLLFHSLGILYMESMVENDFQLGLQGDLFDNLILNAAAVN